ncbi:phosphatidylserine decarboxylase [Vibrio mangrovi]|uniref:Phosphatidylserine decarboxylase n=1 Tax=Vibrio mangrovi TaxID=474394 RepID=A0A1Y6IQD5_9VIBR|nr:phosphatidylserine decarboxylase [Vibrio mangrovi]MDW6004193.1 phosphatidylserine decarboxylase [Vibrio mangrovi]SMR99010.1 Phosphatidylserine decarboxylase proenzyme [Vibrio mangrovi]
MTQTRIQYINRESQTLETERVYGEKELLFLYHHKLGALLRKALFNKVWFSHLNAIPKRSWLSKKSIAPFAETFGVDVDEAEKDLAQYQTLDEFFCRRLKPAARPIDQTPGNLISPADGRALYYRIENDVSLFIKQQRVSVAELLLSESLASTLSGGSALVIRLAPKDYHRFHFPCAGHILNSFNLPGPLESVHPIALDSGAKSFFNKRVVTVLQSPELGSLIMVEIGALTIGTIHQSYSGKSFRRGDEKGYFRFGGSTVVLLWGADGPQIDKDILENSAKNIETLIKCGTRIGSLTS